MSEARERLERWLSECGEDVRWSGITYKLSDIATVASEARAGGMKAAARILDAALLPNIAAAIRSRGQGVAE